MHAPILVPLDGSLRAEAILAPLIPLAQATGSGRILVQAIPAGAGIDPGLGMALPAEPTSEQPARPPGWRRLPDRHRTPGRAPGWPIRTAVLAGDPSAAILDYMTDHPEVRLIALALAV